MKLTKTSIDKLKYSKKNNERDVHWDDELSGFGIRVYPSGKKSFLLFYRVKGRQHMKVIGQYGPLTLDQARDRAKKYLAVVVDDKDPLEEKEIAKKTLKFKDFCPIYIDRHAKKHKKSWIEDQRRIERYLIPTFGTMRLDAISRSDIAKFHGDIGKEFPYAANRLIEQLSKMYQLASLWGYLSDQYTNPAKGIQAYKEVKRDRWVKPDELPKLAAAINNEENYYGRQALWLYLLTGLRRDELLRARRDDIDLERKELRISETKSGKVHYVSLSAPALALLEELPETSDNPYILPGHKLGHHLVNIEKIWRRVRKAAGVDDVRLHDLRRTVGSWLAQSGNSLHLIGRVLNQSSQATTAIYARFGQDHVGIAMEKHGKQIIDIAKHKPNTKIKPVTPTA